MLRLAACWCLAGSWCLAATDDSAAQAKAAVRQELDEARSILAAQREQMARERAERATAHETLQMEVRLLRETWRDVQRVTTQRDAERAAATRRAERTRAEYRAALAAVTEFRRAAETLMNAPQRQRHREQLDHIDALLATDEATGVRLDAVEPALALATSLLWHDLPSKPFAGYVLDGTGRVIEGTFIPAGPITYFTSDEPRVAGYVTLDAGGMEPVLSDAPHRRVLRKLDAWATGQADGIPVDVTDGALIKLAQARVSVTERLRQGGVTMIPLLLIGIVCLGIGLWRAAVLRRMSADVNPVVTRLLDRLRAGDEAAARAEAAATMVPWRDVLTDAVAHAGADRVYLEEILQDRIVMQVPRVSQYLGALAICAAAAPLLGLLGTVTGMIHTFELITVFGTGDARSLSGGISEALITTQVGLIIAVPALLAHAYLSRRAKQIIAGLEQAAIRFVRALDADPQGDAP